MLCFQFAAIPVEEAEKSTHVAIVVTARGGHIGFLEGAWPDPKDQYMGRLFGEFFVPALCVPRFEQCARDMLQEFQKRQK